MSIVTGPDRLRSFIDLIVESLDEAVDGTALAQRAHLSRFHFDRLLGAALGESPGAFRRRLLLERAAWQIVADGASVTEAALDAGYGSTEAFTRAFGRAFGTAPSRYPSSERRGFRLSAPNGVHFHPPGGLSLDSDRNRRHTMDLTERQLEHDLWLTRLLFDAASELPDSALDERLELEPLAHEPGCPSIRGLLYRLVFTKEMWTASVKGETMPDRGDLSVDALRRRLDAAGSEFALLMRDVDARSDWDAAFVDTTCDPPRSFTYGAMAAHVLNFSAYRRLILIGELERHGLDVGIGDPVEWERVVLGGGG